MRPPPAYPNRQSVRLPDYDYGTPGAYFVTVVTEGRRSLLGSVSGGEMRLNDAGAMIERWWREIERKFQGAACDASVVMPNHFHGIVMISQPEPTTNLARIVAWFKTMTTNAYIDGVRGGAWPAFEKRLWQRSYHEHVIRSEAKLDAIRRYIEG